MPLIFVHAGKYVEDFPDIVCDLMLIGAAGSDSVAVGERGGRGGGGDGGKGGSGKGGGRGGGVDKGSGGSGHDAAKIAAEIRDKVILESKSQCTVRFLEKSADSYLG